MTIGEFCLIIIAAGVLSISIYLYECSVRLKAIHKAINRSRLVNKEDINKVA